MSANGVHILKIEVPQDDFAPIVEAAHRNGQTPEQWARQQLVRAAPSPERLAAAKHRLLERIAQLDLPPADNSHNQSIDRDLAREYGSDHSDAA